MEKNILINRVYKIILSIFTIIFGLLFVLFSLTIYFKGKEMIVDNPNYQIYTREIVDKYLSYMIIPFIIWLLMIIGSYLIKNYFPINEKNTLKIEQKITYKLLANRIPENDENYKNQLDIINKERKKRKIVFVIISLLCLLFMIFAARYLFDFSNYSGTTNETIQKDTINMIINVFPWIIASFLLEIGYVVFETLSIQKEIIYIKEILKTYKGQITKNKKKHYTKYINITRVCIFTISVVFIVIGILNGGPATVLHKAVELCMECVGLA